MKSIPDSLSPEAAWNVLTSFAPLGATNIPLATAAGYFVAEDLLVPEDVPSANRSFMDGFAVRAEDVAAVPAKLRVIEEVLMGTVVRKSIGKDESMIIPTGGFLPEGADAVVMQEDTEPNDNHVVIKKSVKAGENVQARAEDFHQGDLLFSKGHRLRSQDLAAIATFGMTSVRVFRKPLLTVISTGNELVSFTEAALPEGKIRETNSFALINACQVFGFECKTGGIVLDEFERQRDAMESAMRTSDIVMVSGGSSVGARDYTLEVIHSFEKSRVHFHGLAIRPGNPTIFATIGNRWVFGLPGQPVSSLIVFYQFVLPMLFRLSGLNLEFGSFNSAVFKMIPAVLAHEVKPLKYKTDYLRVKLQDGKAIPVPGKSASLSTLAHADGFIIVPPGETVLLAGSSVEVVIFP